MSPSGAGAAALAGWRVLVPRPLEQAAQLVDALSAVGAEAVAVELISIESPVDCGPLDRRLRELAHGDYSWVAFTSANAVTAVLDRALALGLTSPVPTGTSVAAVGPATAAALRTAELRVDLLPRAGGSAVALADAWPAAATGQSVLLPRSDLAPALLPDALTAKGYRVETVSAYRTVIQPPPSVLVDELTAGRFDAVLFTSPSTVSALTGVPLPTATVLGAIGRPTAQALLAANRQVGFTADRPTSRGLLDGLLGFASAHPAHKKADVRS